MNGQGTARTCPNGQMAYTIQARDTFFTLSRRFNVSLQSIIDANPGVSPNNLGIGQIICIPGTDPGPPVCPAGSFSYTIVAGDTLFALSRRFGVTQQSILTLNPGLDPNNLRVAQIICIPGTDPGPPVCPAGSFSYTIVAGDTLFALSRRFGVTQQSILALNPGLDPNNLRVAQIICIPGTDPGPPVCPAGSFSYTIVAGDTLFGLSQRFGVTQQSILALNPSIDANNLRVAQIICIPGQAPSVCTCEQNLTAVNRNITLLREESGAQIFADMNYGTSTATTIATTVTPAEIRFDAAEVSFPGNFTCQFTQGMAYAFFMDSASGGQRGLVVRDNFGIWHTFAYSVPVA